MGIQARVGWSMECADWVLKSMNEWGLTTRGQMGMAVTGDTFCNEGTFERESDG